MYCGLNDSERVMSQLRLCLSILVYLAWVSMLHAWYAWDLADNFSIASNPNGQWTYGYMSGNSPHSISVISTIAGTGTASYSGDGSQATSATTNGPAGIAIDSNNNVYFNEFNNHRMRKITASTGIITTYAGIGSAGYSGDGGPASSAALNYPNGLCMDSSGTHNLTYFYRF